MTTLADHVVAIQNVKARYCAAVDRLTGDPEGAREVFRSIFLPDVVGDYGFQLLNGMDALAEFLCTAIAGNSEWRLHMIHSPLVEVTGDTATGDWTVMVHLKRPQTEQVDVIIGRYSDEFRATAEGWRIARVGFARLG